MRPSLLDTLLNAAMHALAQLLIHKPTFSHEFILTQLQIAYCQEIP